MSRPRKPFGTNQPGRLPSTMMKVLAAEMSDPARLRRGKQYAKDGSVIDIDVTAGVVTGEVQGSRSTPYVACLEVSTGDGMPLKRDVEAQCTCPDADNFEGMACKHVLATMFTFADELLIEPELLDVWRGRATAGDDALTDEAEPTDRTDGGDPESARDAGPDRRAGGERRPGRHLHVVRDEPDPAPAATASVEPEPDPLADLLAAPAGAVLPEVPDLVAPTVLPARHELATVLRDALGNLRLDWD